MFITNAEMRRWIKLQLRTVNDCPEILEDRYSNYVSCVGFDQQINSIKTFKEWLSD
jgi:hypothetical protein